MNDKTIEKERIEDFKKILTFHLVDKICHFFKGDYKRFYNAKAAYKRFIDCKTKGYAYTKQQVHAIYSDIICFNAAQLTRNQVAHIFGYYKDKKRINYKDAIANDKSITTVRRGTIYIKDRRFDYGIRYLLPEELIKQIFDDENLLKKVRDAGSDYYSDRQRRLIFTQLLKQKKYHYKTNRQVDAENIKAKENYIPTDAELAELVEGIDFTK